MEHRCGYRRQIEVAVTLRTRNGLVGQGSLREASASGARLVTSVPLALLSVITLTLTPTEKTRTGRRPKLQAEVVRRAESGYGVEWVEFAPPQLRAFYDQDSLRKSLIDDIARNITRALTVRHR